MTRSSCAIYTRKSSDEGPEREFNSLDAQWETCEAFITSQKHAGWAAVRDLYDDGGLSGGTLERPHCSGCSPISRPAIVSAGRTRMHCNFRSPEGRNYPTPAN